MSTNFKITGRRKGKCLEINLAGDFDGSSAFALLRFLSRNYTGSVKAVINTSKLGKIYSFGQEIFECNRCLLAGHHGVCLEFIGKNAHKVAPEWAKCA